MSPVVGHLLRRAARSLWENLYLNTVASGVIAMGLLLVGVYMLVMFNLHSIVDDWERDVHVSAYFYTDVPVDRRFAVKEDVARLEEVADILYVSEDDARAYLIERVPDMAEVLDELGSEVLPASLEITLADSSTRPSDIAAFAEKIAGPDFEEIDFGQEWVQRFNTFLSLLQLLGLIMGGLILATSVFLVGNTMHLVTYTRRSELETMKLVGATWMFIAIPFFLEGVAQGLLGAGLAIGGLFALHNVLVLQLQEYLQLAIGGNALSFLPWQGILLLCLVGATLGVSGCLISVRRFWRLAP